VRLSYGPTALVARATGNGSLQQRPNRETKGDYHPPEPRRAHDVHGTDRIASVVSATPCRPVLRNVARADWLSGEETQRMASVFTGWLLAFVLGARHASEPDHLVAVSTLIAEQRGALRAMLLGAVWGVGHSISLFAVGLILLFFHLELSEHMADLFELGVVIMLLGLGTRSIMRAFRSGRQAQAAYAVAAHADHTHHAHHEYAHHAYVQHDHVHRDHAHHDHGRHDHARHERHGHEHTHTIDHLHVGRWTVARQPLMIGLVHGLAGSGALTALVLATMPSFSSGLIYMASFGAGSVLGMALLTGLVGLPLRRLTQRHGAQAALSACAGLLSFSLAIYWGWPVVLRLHG
jgi:ABC-type nickel/cobalt efflux system permease component RcnA